MEAERPRAEGEAFGAWLRQHREVRGIELREIADSSKIGIAYLQAFEEERFDLLPAPVFAKGFLRQYAAYVGIDPEEVVNFYLSACLENSEDSESSPEPQGRPQSSSSPRFVVIALVLLAALAISFWAIGRFGVTPSPAEDPPPAVQAPPVAVPSASVTDPSPPASAGSTVPLSEAPLGPGAGQSADGAPAVAESTTLVDEASAPLRVVVDFSGECWVEATIDGVQRHAEIKVQGESLQMEAQETVDLKVGDARVVQIEVNGRPYALPSRSGTSVRSVRIDRETLASLTLDAVAEGEE